jgi:hypothetical protein
MTVAVAGGVTTISTGGGGGSSPYIVPLLANFTVISTPSGATSSNSSTGLALKVSATGRNTYDFQDNGTLGSTFTVTAGFKQSFFGSDIISGIYVKDSAGKAVSWGRGYSGATTVMAVAWTVSGGVWTPTSAFTEVNNTLSDPNDFSQMHWDGTNITLSAGADLNSILNYQSFAASTYLTGTVSEVGIMVQANSGAQSTTFFHYTHNA